jgi:hypothetical protein
MSDEVTTMRWIERARSRWLRGVSFCDGCGSVCDADCRRLATLERHRMAPLELGLPR